MGRVNDLFNDIDDLNESPIDENTQNALNSLDALQATEQKNEKIDGKKQESTKKSTPKKTEIPKTDTKKVSKTAETKKAVEKTEEPKKVVEKTKSNNTIKVKCIEDVTPDIAKKAGLDDDYVTKYNSLPVKAKSKFINLINWLLFDEQLSIYTLVCFKHLINKNEAKSADLKIALMSNTERPYPIGTASSQAGQLMSVFPAMNIGKLNEKTIVLQSSSPLVIKFENKY